MSLKIFRQGALEGVKLDKVQKGHDFQPPLSRKMVNDFSKFFVALGNTNVDQCAKFGEN